MEYKMQNVRGEDTKKEYDFECSKILSHNIAKFYKADKSKLPEFSGSPTYDILDNSIEIPQQMKTSTLLMYHQRICPQCPIIFPALFKSCKLYLQFLFLIHKGKY